MIALLATMLLLSIGGLIALYLWNGGHLKERPVEAPKQQILLQGIALEWRDKQVDCLFRKITDRALEISKADSRFLVTTDDMKKAYEEIIREEHM